MPLLEPGPEEDPWAAPKPLPAEALRRTLAPEKLGLSDTSELDQLERIIGQDRAVRAVAFGIGIHSPGFNIHAVGPAGTGKMTTIRRYLEKQAASKLVPDDWCYVNNFVEEHEPRVLRLPAGRGNELRNDMSHLIREAHYRATEDNGSSKVRGEHVEKAIEERVYRANLIEERIQEEIARGTIHIETQGQAVGQVNGLSVVQLADYPFAKPARVTGRTFVGRQGVVNIEREIELSGRLHSKGVLILAGYLGGTYALKRPLTLSASVTFEQSYEEIDGDSASSTELYALLSSLSDYPLRQDVAVTGAGEPSGERGPGQAPGHRGDPLLS